MFDFTSIQAHDVFLGHNKLVATYALAFFRELKENAQGNQECTKVRAKLLKNTPEVIEKLAASDRPDLRAFLSFRGNRR